MNSRRFEMMHDHWLQSGNPEDEPEFPICSYCDEFMEYEKDVEVDENGRPYISGGSWHCVNKDCSSKNA